MIYKFRMITGDEKAFLRDYEIKATDTFQDFHEAIQVDLGYDPSQLASFFLTDEQWNKGLELTLIDMQNDGGPAAIPMDSVTLQDLLKDRKDRLLYVYDIFAEKAFFIELLDILDEKPGREYPYCTASVGEAPEQSSLDDLGLNDLDSIEDDDSEFNEIFDDIDGFDADELGFDETYEE
ncbi:Plasmid pRiA4b ORF-3-like protein [anaerobic digester metagenome]